MRWMSEAFDLGRSLEWSLWGLDYLGQTALFLADVTQLDLMSAQIVLTIAHANTGHVVSGAHIASRFAGLNDVPPDSLRLPISGYAVARQLGLPLETARRHILKLQALGWCQRVGEGFLIPEAVWRDPAALQAVVQNCRRTVAAVRQAPVAVAPVPPPAVTEGIVRWINRASTEFFSEGMGGLTRALGLNGNQVLLMAGLQTRSLAAGRRAAFSLDHLQGFASQEVLESRRAVTAFELSRRYSLPYETTRRGLARLRDLGWAQPGPDGGLMAAPAFLDGSEHAAAWEAFDAQAQRLVDVVCQGRDPRA